MVHLFEPVGVFLMYVVPGTIAAGCLLMLLRFERRMSAFETHFSGAKDSLKSQAEELAKKLSGIYEAPPTSATAEPRPAAQPASVALNATTRSKVLKMHRLGGTPEQIATALNTPKGEVMLLLKVHQIVMQAIEQPRSGLETAGAEEKV